MVTAALLTKVYTVKSGFSSSPVWMWELDHKKVWAPKNWCFQIVVLEKTLEPPLDSKDITLVYPKGTQPWMFIGRLMLKLKLQYFGHLMWRADSLVKTFMLGKIEGKRRRGPQRMRWLDGITDSMGHEFEQAPGDSERQGSLACCNPWGHKELDMAYWLKDSNRGTGLLDPITWLPDVSLWLCLKGCKRKNIKFLYLCSSSPTPDCKPSCYIDP